MGCWAKAELRERWGQVINRMRSVCGSAFAKFWQQRITSTKAQESKRLVGEVALQGRLKNG
jgi:hypothetical protein